MSSASRQPRTNVATATELGIADATWRGEPSKVVCKVSAGPESRSLAAKLVQMVESSKMPAGLLKTLSGFGVATALRVYRAAGLGIKIVDAFEFCDLWRLDYQSSA